MEDENVEIVRRSHALYRAGELDAAIDQYLAPDIEWETRWPGLQPWFYGRDGVREWTRRALQPMDIDMELIDARAIDQDVVLAQYRVSGRGRGSKVPTEMTIFDLLWLRNGMIYRRRTFYSEREALETLGAPARGDG
jgi:ketosteroid isomerase-like protein